MKVILLKDVRKVGKKYDIKDVSDGYALNFLIPNKLAEVSNESNLKKVQALKARDEAHKKISEDLLAKNLKSLEGIAIQLKESASEKGHLFRGVHKEEIIQAIKKQTEIDMAPEYITLDKPIKETGEHQIEVRVQDTSVKFNVVISAER